MRNRMVVVVLAVVLGIGGYAAVALARASQPTGDAQGLVESSTTEDDTKMFSSNVAEFGMELKDAIGLPAVPEESAIAIARKEIAGMIVTFHGVHMLHSGLCMVDTSGNQISSTRDPYVFGDTNVVLDAETGEVLEIFSYSTPEAAPSEIATTLPSWNGTSLRDMAVQWAARCGKEHPKDIRFVETTRQQAAKLLDGAKVDSDNACYAVVLHGNFVDTKAFMPYGAQPPCGTTMAFIVRSSDGVMTDFWLNDLPYADLHTLGTVNAIAP